jgi:hypothetical protein
MARAAEELAIAEHVRATVQWATIEAAIAARLGAGG